MKRKKIRRTDGERKVKMKERGRGKGKGKKRVSNFFLQGLDCTLSSIVDD
jgi:hypothetical protein